MTDEPASTVRTVTTLGLAVSGPATLLSGLVTLATIPRGIPAAVVVIFAFSAAATVLFVVLYLADDVRRR